ncbi:lipoprotein [Planococcus sp. SE5232]|nr:lipoprotein [uncultured Planococcus sp.]
MRKLFLLALAALLLAGCSFEVRDADPDQEDGFTIDLKDNKDGKEEDEE